MFRLLTMCKQGCSYSASQSAYEPTALVTGRHTLRVTVVAAPGTNRRGSSGSLAT